MYVDVFEYHLNMFLCLGCTFFPCVNERNRTLLDMTRRLAPLVAAAFGALLGCLVHGRPPPQEPARRQRGVHDHWDGQPEHRPDDWNQWGDHPGDWNWYEPQPEPEHAVQHEWQDNQHFGNSGSDGAGGTGHAGMDSSHTPHWQQWDDTNSWDNWGITPSSTWTPTMRSRETRDGRDWHRQGWDDPPWPTQQQWQPSSSSSSASSWQQQQWQPSSSSSASPWQQQHQGWDQWQHSPSPPASSWHQTQQGWKQTNVDNQWQQSSSSSAASGGYPQRVRERQPTSSPSTSSTSPTGDDTGGRSYLYIPGWGRGAPLLPPHRRAEGFFRQNEWQDRPRNDWEERFQRGGGGERRTERRSNLMRQWGEGTFRPAAMRRAQQEGQDYVIDQAARENARRVLQQGHVDPHRAPPQQQGNTAGASGDPHSTPPQQPGTTAGASGATSTAASSTQHQVRSREGEGRTTVSSRWWTMQQWNDWEEWHQQAIGGLDAAGTWDAELVIDWSERGLPDLECHRRCWESAATTTTTGLFSCPPDSGTPWDTAASTTTTGASSCSTTTSTSSSLVTEAIGVGTTSSPTTSSPAAPPPVHGVEMLEEDQLVMMQTNLQGATRDDENADSQTEGGPSTGASDGVDNHDPAQGAADTTTTESEQHWTLQAWEREDLLQAGWDVGMVEDLNEILMFIGEVDVAHTAWALGTYTHATILADTMVELATDVLLRRVGGVQENRPAETGVRGRLCVGLGGFHRQLSEFHCSLVQRALQQAWCSASDLGDDRPPAGGMLQHGTAADALRVARARAQHMVEQARLRRGGVTNNQLDTGVPAEDDGGVTNNQQDTGVPDEDDGADDGMSLMQLSQAEEQLLADRGVDDRVRRQLRDLLQGLSSHENYGDGPEYRWALSTLLDAVRDARLCCEVLEGVLRDRCRPSQYMHSWPAQRVPPWGALRSRVVSWLSEPRNMFLLAFNVEMCSGVLQMSGCPPPGMSQNVMPPSEESSPAGARGRGTRDVPRGSCSRSRSPVLATRDTGGVVGTVLPGDARPGSSLTVLGVSPLPLRAGVPEAAALPVRADEVLPGGVASALPVDMGRARAAGVAGGPYAVTESSGTLAPRLTGTGGGASGGATPTRPVCEVVETAPRELESSTAGLLATTSASSSAGGVLPGDAVLLGGRDSALPVRARPTSSTGDGVESAAADPAALTGAGGCLAGEETAETTIESGVSCQAPGLSEDGVPLGGEGPTVVTVGSPVLPGVVHLADSVGDTVPGSPPPGV